MEAETQKETSANADAHSRMSLLRDGASKYERSLIYRAIWNLAWPAVFAQGVRSIVMFVVRVVVSDMGEKAYNSVNIGLMVFMVILTIIAAGDSPGYAFSTSRVTPRSIGWVHQFQR